MDHAEMSITETVTEMEPLPRDILITDFRFGFDSGVAFVSIDHPPINLLDEVLSKIEGGPGGGGSEIALVPRSSLTPRVATG
jgi:hypothetical protein